MTSRLTLVARLLGVLPFIGCAGHAEATSTTPHAPPVAIAAAAPSAPLAASELTVDLTADGATRADGAPVTDEALLRTARAAHDANPDLRVVIRAEATVTHGRTIQLLDLLKQAGVTKFALEPAGGVP